MLGPLLLSQIVGAPVVDADGGRWGRVADLAADLTSGAVEALVVAADGRRLALPAAEAAWHDGRVVADPHRVTAVGGSGLVRRDVLDVQVVDAAGHRVTRVSDVQLAWDAPGPRVIAVDVSAAGVLRRLGLGVVAGRGAGRSIAWRHLHPTGDRARSLRLDPGFHPPRRRRPVRYPRLARRLRRPRAGLEQPPDRLSDLEDRTGAGDGGDPHG
jgi:sporulation protein YlmC with PRC-barrel domain